MSYNHNTSDGDRIFSPVYADVWDLHLKGMNGSDVKVYIALLMHTTQQDRTWFMSIDEIAEDAGVSRSTASAAKDRLLAAGLFQQVWRYRDDAGDYHVTDTRPPPRMQGKNEYTVKVKPQIVESENRNHDDADRVRKSDPIESENRNLVESENRNPTVAPSPEPPPEPLGSSVDEPAPVADAPAPKKSRKKPKLPLPDGWTPPDHTVKAMADECPAVDQEKELRLFRDHWLSKDERRASWDATYRNWIRKAAQWAKPAAGKKQAPDVEKIMSWGINWEEDDNNAGV